MPSLDGIRAFAVLAVMVYHARFAWLPGGFLGVSTFFTLSGFLITSLLLREWTRDSRISLRSFWSRRFRRLLPAAWTTLVLVLALGAFGAWNDDQLRALRGDVPFSLLEVVNWHFVFQDRSYGAGFVAPSPLEHFWSLAVEEQFYIFLPVIVGVVLVASARTVPRARLGRLTAVIATLAVVGATLNWGLARSVSTDRAYFGTDTRMAELLVGALLAGLTLRRLRATGRPARAVIQLLGLLAVAVTIALWSTARVASTWLYPWGLLVSAAGSAGMIAAALDDGPLSRVLSLRPLVWLGKVSYGTYLVHWPIFLVLTPARTGLGEWPQFALRLGVTLATATLMFHLVEDPIRRRRVLADRRVIYAGVGVVAVIGLSLPVVTRNLEAPSPIQLAARPNATTTIPIPPLKVLVLGDQYAETLARTISGAESMPVSVESVADCGLAVGGWVQVAGLAAEQDVRRCRYTIKTWTDAITAEQPDVVIVTATARDASPRRLETDAGWSVPGDESFAALLTGMFSESFDELRSAADPIGAELVAVSSVNTVRGVPAPSTPREPDPDPQVEGLRSELERRTADGQPPMPDQAVVDQRTAIIDTILKGAAGNSGLRFVDMAQRWSQLAGQPVTVDLAADQSPANDGVAKQLRTWLSEELRATSAQPPTVPRASRNPDDIKIPDAPPPRPRRYARPGTKPSIMVARDSVAMGLALGLSEWSQGRKAEFPNATELGCGISRGGSYRFQRDTFDFAPSCEWADTFPKLVSSFRPNLVMLSSSIWEVVDRRLIGDGTYRHLGDPLIDRYVLSEFLSAVDVLGSDGATVAVVIQPHITSGLDKGFQNLPESDPARIDRLNEILRQVIAMRPGVAVPLDLQQWVASQPGGEMDTSLRPDGLHFSKAATRRVAAWLGPELIRLSRGPT